MEYLELVNLIKNNAGKYPDLKTIDNIVYKKIFQSFQSFSRDSNELDCWRIWILSSLKSKLIDIFHSPPDNSHGGVLKILSKIREFFYWPKIAYDVKLFINNCTVCNEIKSEHSNIYILISLGHIKKPHQAIPIYWLCQIN